jgi:hypothetical protein
MFDDHRLRNYGTNAARSSQSSKSNDEMNEKDDKITHLGIVSKPQNVGPPAYLVIRQGQVCLSCTAQVLYSFGTLVSLRG